MLEFAGLCPLSTDAHAPTHTMLLIPSTTAHRGRAHGIIRHSLDLSSKNTLMSRKGDVKHADATGKTAPGREWRSCD